MDIMQNKTVEFEDGNSMLVDELNKRTFTKDMLSEEDYYIKVGQTSPELKEKIKNELAQKFNISTSNVLDEIKFENPDGIRGYTVYSMLMKNFEFIEPFDKLGGFRFDDSEGYVEYFGINNASDESLNQNVEVLFYNNQNDFAVKLKTKENEELILYMNDNYTSFNDMYNEIEEKSKNYTGDKIFNQADELKVPYITVDTIINYDELCGRFIKGTNEMYISNAIQNVKFTLNEKGGNLISEAAVVSEYNKAMDLETRFFNFTKPFIIFMKEENKSKPYFSLKVDNDNVLKVSE